MKWGIGSYTLPWHIGIGDLKPQRPLDAFGLMEAALEQGAKVVQYCENLPLTRLSLNDRQALLSLARQEGIQVEVGTRGLDREEIEACAEIAAQAGSSFVRLVVDRPGDEPTPDELALRLAGFAPLFREHKMMLAIENHDRFPSEILASLVKEGGEDWLGICFDTANSLGCLEGPWEGLETLLPFLVNLHLKDVVAVREPHMLGFRVRGTPVGEGSARLRLLAQRVSEARPHVNAIAEHWLAPLATIEETAAEERVWLARSCAALKTWLA